jgi:hypothetical protein
MLKIAQKKNWRKNKKSKSISNMTKYKSSLQPYIRFPELISINKILKILEMPSTKLFQNVNLLN